MSAMIWSMQNCIRPLWSSFQCTVMPSLLQKSPRWIQDKKLHLNWIVLNKYINIVSNGLIPIQEMSTVVTSISLSYPCFRLYVNWEVNPNPTPFERIDKQAHMAQKILWKWVSSIKSIIFALNVHLTDLSVNPRFPFWYVFEVGHCVLWRDCQIFK